MSIIDQASSSLGGLAWGSLGQALFIFIIFFAVILVVGIISFMIWWKSYNINVTIFTPMGQVQMSDEELKVLQDEVLAGKTPNVLKTIRFDYIKKRRTHGKHISHRGTAFFALFVPLKKIKPVSLEYIYNDGVFLLQLSRDIFIPIVRPSFVVTVAQNVSISVAEQQEWISWSNMMADRINAKYQNPDMEKKQTLYFVIGICAMVIIGSLLLWLIYQSAKKGLDVKGWADELANTIKQGVPVTNAGAVPK